MAPASDPANNRFLRLCKALHNRKNHLFAGSDGGAEHWAILVSLIETCKLDAINPEANLTWLFGKLALKRRMADIDELLPSCCLGLR